MLESASSITIATLVLGLITGVLSGSLGIGGGVVVVPALVLLFNVPQKGAQGLSLALMVPMALLGAIQYWRLGHLQISAMRLTLLCAGALGGILIGSALADRLPAAVLRRAFAVLMLVMAARMLWPDRKPATNLTSEPEREQTPAPKD
jgi:uncharacterized protein